uniref:Diphthamide synthase domain-containing protein n=1 Tax=Ignisphaera aggregans TaxID=334771 RepID=A0A7C5YY15_9CREN
MDQCKENGIDPLGEKGEYHTLVVNSPIHIKKTRYRKIDIVEYDNYRILIVV